MMQKNKKTKKTTGRKNDREWVFKILFASSFGQDTPQKEFDLLKENFEIDLTVFGKEYLKLIEKVFFSDTLMEPIKNNLEKIELPNISRMAQIILQMGVFEMLYFPDVPPEITINELLNISKQYVENRERRLINSILDKIFKKFQKDNLLNSEFIKPLRG